MNETPFCITCSGELRVPVLGHVPHGAVFIPEEVRDTIILDDEELESELILMTDRYTPELFDSIVASGGLALVNKISRLVVDPERFERDEDEVMSRRGMGAIYSRTAHQRTLRRELLSGERDELLSHYYRPYHEALRAEVQKMLERFDRCLIIDCHSFSSLPLPYELDQARERPDICIGTDPFHTPNELAVLAESFCESRGRTPAINSPFSGTCVPLAYLGKDRRVSSMMIEVNRSLYMDERTGGRSRGFSETKRFLDDLIRWIIDRSQNGIIGR